MFVLSRTNEFGTTYWSTKFNAFVPKHGEFGGPARDITVFHNPKDLQDLPQEAFEGQMVAWDDFTGRNKYKIVRIYQNANRRRTIATGLTLDQAQAHCDDPETSSSTCNKASGRARTRKYGPWFDGYEAEGVT